MRRSFLKMNGLGNDFVVVEAHAAEPFVPTADQVRAIADRKTGIGCDQVVVMSPSHDADIHLRFWNAAGDEAGACGNASRCVAWLLMEATEKDAVTMETASGVLKAWRDGPLRVSVDMGKPRLSWEEIPLAEAMDTRGVELQVGPIDNPILHTPGCVSMGNPHAVFFVPDAETAPVREAGSLVEHHPLFPEGVNVGFAQIKARDRIRLRVWERGAGLTKACGTGACAALVAAVRRRKTDRKAVLELDGGELVIEWRAEDDHVIMSGATELEFTGVLP
jgi:diaminopimelate epimerase